MNNDTITITLSDWDNNMASTAGTIAQDITTIDLTGTSLSSSYVTSDTITLTGIEDLYTNVTKAEHNELLERVTKLEAVMAEEAELRANHPALKMAYDEYRLLLVLAKQHTPDILTDE